jgi:hypothetical protein
MLMPELCVPATPTFLRWPPSGPGSTSPGAPAPPLEGNGREAAHGNPQSDILPSRANVAPESISDET